MYSNYNDLHFYSQDSGGYCHCGSESLKHFIKHTVTQEVWASNKDEALQVALDLDDWNVHEQYYEESKDE